MTQLSSSHRLATLACLALLATEACAPSSPPRSAAPVPAFAKRAEGRQGMVSASHPAAAAAGLEILKAGGNAVDAAIAVAFALAVVDPSQTGIGAGGGMVVWHGPTQRSDAIVFYSRTGADPDWARLDTARARAPINPRAAGVPGAVAGLLDSHARWGRLSRSRLLAPAIRLARDGFIVSPLLARTAEASRTKLEADSAAARVFLPGGRAVGPGDRLIQAELAATLEAIAETGPAAFYDGPLARRAVDHLRAAGSLITLDDWRGYRPVAARPLCTPWAGFTLLSVPPPLGGVTVLETLNLLAARRADTLGSPTADGRAALALIGAMQVANADRRRWRGDPSVYGVPARGMASPAFAAHRGPLAEGKPDTLLPAGDPWAADRGGLGAPCDALDPWPPSDLGPSRAAAESAPGGDDGAAASLTSHFSVVDDQRNAVAVTFTVGVLFGSGVYVNGFFLNSGGANFDEATRGPSRFGSSTIAPTIVLRDGRVRLVVGAAGSQYIPTSITQVAFRTLALGEDPWLAIAAPRLQPGRGAQVEIEAGFAETVYQAVRARGYDLVSRTGDLMFGGVHAIAVSPGGVLIGVADPRRDGAAAGW